MPRSLTNKQIAVLELLRQGDRELTVQQINDELADQMPCPVCGGTGEGEEEGYNWRKREFGKRCAKCHGRGKLWVDFAYQALQRLMKDGFVTRREQLDEWGDPLRCGPHRYRAVPLEPNPDDPLEQAFNLPARGD